jgi:hypothetical protein
MLKYRVSGKVSYATSDRDGDPKAFKREFEADSDDDARAQLPLLRGTAGVHWENVVLRLIVVEEQTREIPIQI